MPGLEPPDEAVDWEALARYLTGESSPDEAARVRSWIEADPERSRLVTNLDRSIGRLAAEPPSDLDVESALARVKARINEPTVLPFPARAPARPEPARAPWGGALLRIAAVLMVLFGGTLLLRQLRRSDDTVLPGAMAARVFETGVGERDSVTLPDGSRVLLGPASRVVVAAAYGEFRREVELQGEALFDVVHNDARPFSVRAGGAEIDDLGTTFLVQSVGSGEVRVIVTEGRVRLHPIGAPEEQGVTLREGERGVLEADGRVIASRAPATESDLDWTEGRLVFNEAPLAEVAAELRRWYGVELVADPALAGRQLTASFVGESAEEVLNFIRLAIGARLEMRGDTAVLHPSGAAGVR